VKYTRAIGAAGTAIALLASASACGGDDAEATADGSVKVTTFGCEFWNLYAEDAGVFEEHDLDVEFVSSGGGSAAVAAVVSEAADFGYVNGYTAINAFNTGMPIRMVSGIAVNALPPAEPAQGVFVAKDSDISSAQDLVGKKIAVNEINGINQIVTSAWLAAEGVEPIDVQFVALPFPDQAPAVVSGKVDAAQLGYELLGDNYDAVTSIVDPFAEVGTVMIAGYVASEDTVADGDTAERFHAALTETVETLQSDQAAFDRALELQAECQDVPLDVLKTKPQNGMDAAADLDMLGAMAQQMVDLGMLPETPDLETFVPEFARQ
jgi:NitT/TauT family transport system substrate-binding protein